MRNADSCVALVVSFPFLGGMPDVARNFRPSRPTKAAVLTSEWGLLSYGANAEGAKPSSGKTGRNSSVRAAP